MAHKCTVLHCPIPVAGEGHSACMHPHRLAIISLVKLTTHQMPRLTRAGLPSGMKVLYTRSTKEKVAAEIVGPSVAGESYVAINYKRDNDWVRHDMASLDSITVPEGSGVTVQPKILASSPHKRQSVRCAACDPGALFVGGCKSLPAWVPGLQFCCRFIGNSEQLWLGTKILHKITL